MTLKNLHIVYRFSGNMNVVENDAARLIVLVCLSAIVIRFVRMIFCSFEELGVSRNRFDKGSQLYFHCLALFFTVECVDRS